MTSEPILFKPTGTTQLSNPFNLGERKLLNTLMFNAQNIDEVTASEHDMPLDDVFDSLGWEDSKNEDELQKYCRKLLSTIVEWNQFGKDRRKAWRACQFISSFEIKNQTLHYQINPMIVAEVKRPELYGKVHMLVQTHLKKKHSQVLYEYFQDEIGRKKEKVIVLENVTIHDLTEVLGINDSEYYKKYKHLNAEILKPCTKEINKHSDVDVVYSAVRHGRSTVGIKFTLMKADAYQLALDLKEKRAEKDHGPLLKDKLQDRLEYFGITHSVALKIVEKYSSERVQNNIRHLESEIKRGQTIKNRAAWLRKAIEEDWQPVQSQAEIEASVELQENAKNLILEKQEQQRLADLKSDFEKFRIEATKTKFHEKSKSFQTRRTNNFIKYLQDENNEIVLDRYTKEGIDCAMVRAYFTTYLMEELLTEDHELYIDAFAMWKKELEAA